VLPMMEDVAEGQMVSNGCGLAVSPEARPSSPLRPVEDAIQLMKPAAVV
jgi:hypothetical protein